MGKGPSGQRSENSILLSNRIQNWVRLHVVFTSIWKFLRNLWGVNGIPSSSLNYLRIKDEILIGVVDSHFGMCIAVSTLRMHWSFHEGRFRFVRWREETTTSGQR